MKPVPLHVVRYFKGEDTRLLSKHLHSGSAFQVANRFASNLKDKHNEGQDTEVIISISKESPQELTIELVSRQEGRLDEGVRVLLEDQRDPNWDYPTHDDPRVTDSGQLTTAPHRHEQPFTLNTE